MTITLTTSGAAVSRWLPSRRHLVKADGGVELHFDGRHHERRII